MTDDREFWRAARRFETFHDRDPRKGDVVAAILDAATDWPPDLIGMATAGHHGFLDALRGSTELFTREDLVDAQWRIIEPILGDVTPIYRYRPGTWGPDEAVGMIGTFGPWHDPRPAHR